MNRIITLTMLLSLSVFSYQPICAAKKQGRQIRFDEIKNIAHGYENKAQMAQTTEIFAPMREQKVPFAFIKNFVSTAATISSMAVCYILFYGYIISTATK